jgi:hypothetical protein
MPYEVALTYRDDEHPRQVTLVGVLTEPEVVHAVAEYFEQSRGPLPYAPPTPTTSSRCGP